MSTEKLMYVETVLATEDLSGAQYKVVDIAGTVAASTSNAIGVLLNKPEDGEHMSVGVVGRLRGVATGTIAAAAQLTVTTSGFITTVASGGGVIIGKNTNASVASGLTFSFFGNFINASNVT